MKASRFLVSASVSMAGLLCGCRHEPAQAPPSVSLTIAAASSDGVYYSVGKALATVYSRLPGVEATAETRNSTELNVEEIESGAADLTFDGAGHAYVAFKHGTPLGHGPLTRLRAIAVLFSTAVQIAVRTDSDIRRIEDLRGKRVAVGAHGSLTEEASQLTLESHGLSFDRIVPAFYSGRNVVEELREGRLDGFFLYAPLRHSVMQDLAASAHVRLIPIARERIRTIQAGSPFLLKTVVIPSGTYKGQTQDVATVGADILLLCRRDLPDQLVRDLTRALFDSTRELTAAHPAAAEIDPDRGPATSIPLHPGAARYYRERELLR